MVKKTPMHVVPESLDDDPIAPVTVGNPLSAADLAIDQSQMDDFMSVEEGPAEVPCAKPPKGTFFAVYHETGTPWVNRRFYFMMEIPNRDPFLVHPIIAKQKKEEGEDTIRPVLIVRYVTMAGDEGLWALKLDPPDGKSNLWNRSALKALLAAEKGGPDGESQWVRLFSGKGQYTHTVSPKKIKDTPPKFSSRTFDEMVNSAFPAEQVVLNGDHQIWIDLAQGSDKK